MSDMYTLSELSRMTGISQAALSKRILRGKLAAQKDDKGHWVVAAEDVDRLRQGRRGRTVSPSSPESPERSAVQGAEDRTAESVTVESTSVDPATSASSTNAVSSGATVTAAEIDALKSRLARKRAEIGRMEASLAGLKESASLLEQLLAAKIELMDRQRRA
ncbi:helix-turn-helix domain-containing protein [Bifidobacterium simiarum]|uniref:Helix-turn-helix domain-containing protein n=1 Tax=Bifidobacterium simiarum TaxID=2045441 RepID=A0A2M9HC99_9BIFI|nr:helix-turn-helix domain-containing protein [Bifidobacterium simiarum]MBT1166936.1 hypothetical protein [Bifidobacterium simiarum]PJM74436.1 hypothetical protein CSQ87_10120 [Bifidobacterium simiarum]